MVTNRNSVVLSLENHLFFSRMMKEHAIFLEVSFAGMNQHIAKEADRYKVKSGSETKSWRIVKRYHSIC